MRNPLMLLAVIVVAAVSVAQTSTMVRSQGASETTSLDGVTSIAVNAAGRVSVTIGSPAELVISGPREAIDQLSVTVSDDELEVEPAGSIDPPPGEELQFAITLPSLEDIWLRGSVSLEAAGLSGELDVQLEGATTATISEVQLTELDVDLRGAALLTMSGSVEHLDVEVHESSTFDGAELVAGSAEVESRDAATATVNVTGALDADARAASTIRLTSEPASTDITMQDAAAVVILDAAPVIQASPSPGASPAATPAARASEHEVGMAGRAFAPSTLEIQVGDTVTWTNDDDTEHTVTASDGLFDSGQLAEGGTFAFTFDTAGEYSYFCAIHPEMQGRVVVSG
jgi:plastocyanin